MGLDQQRCELRTSPRVAADGQGSECVAVVALATGDEVSSLRLTLLDEVLPRHLEGSLDGLRAAADEIDVVDASRGMGDEVFAKLLCDGCGEEARVRIGKLVELGVHGRQHIGMSVTEAGDRRTS